MRNQLSIWLVVTAMACTPRGTSEPKSQSADGTQSTTLVQQSPTGMIDDIAFAPSGSRLAVFSDGHLRIYDVATRSLLSTTRYGSYLGGGLTSLASAVWSKEDRLTVSGANGGAVLGTDGHMIGPFPAKLMQLRGTTDGSILGVFGMTVRHVGVHSFSARLDGAVSTLATTPDGKIAAWYAGFDQQQIHVAEIETLPQRRDVDVGFDLGGLALSSDGQTAFIGGTGNSFDDNQPSALYEVSLAPSRGHAPIRLITGEGPFREVVVSPDQRYVAGASNALVVWDRTTKKGWQRSASELDGQRGPGVLFFQQVAFSADSRWLAASTSAGVHIFELATGRYMGALGEDVRASYVVEFRDDNRLISGTRLGITEWDLRDGHVVRRDALSARISDRLDDHTFRLVSPSECGAFQLGLHLWTATDVPGEGMVEEMEADQYCFPTGEASNKAQFALGQPRAIAYTRVANDREDSELAVQGLDDNVARPLPGSLNPGVFMFSPDGRMIAAQVGDFPKQAALWNVAGGEPTIIAKPRHGFSMHLIFRPFAFSSDSVHVAFIDAANLWILNTRTTKLEANGLAPFGENVALEAVAFAADNETWVAVSDLGAVAVGRGATVMVRRSSLEVAPVSVAIRGNRIAIAMRDGGIRILDARTLEELANLVEFEDEEDVAVTPQGAFRGTTEAAQRISVVYAQPDEVFRMDRVASSLQNPELVARVLRGEAPPLPAVTDRPPRVALTSAAALVGTRARVPIVTARAATVRVFGEGQQLLERACAGTCTLAFDSLPGVKRYEIVAFDGAKRSSNPIEVVLPENRRAERGLWLLAAGVSDYPDLAGFDRLRSADADACELAEAFTSLRDMKVREATTLINGAVTTEAVLQVLHRFEAMGPGDLAVLFFSGHSVRGRDGESIFLTSAVEAKEGVPVPASIDKHGIRWAALAEPLRRLRGRVLILLDTCHSGGFGQAQVVASSELADELNHDGRSGVVVFASSKGRQRSAEYGADAASNAATTCRALPRNPNAGGFFRRAIVDALGNSAKHDLDGDGLRVSELVDAVSRRVHRQTSGAQTPWVARRETFADFLLVSHGGTP